MSTFDYWLAQYRARVKETFYTLEDKTNLWPMTYSESIQNQHDKSTILVIEDSVDEWFLLRWMLSKQFPTAETVWFSDTTQTLAYLERYTWSEQSLPVMILLDLYLPSAKAGLSLLQSIKAHPNLASVPVVMISRSDLVEDIALAFDYTSDAFVVKPEDYLDWRDAFTLLNRYWPNSDTLV